MAKADRKFVIINSAEVSSVDFSEVLELSADTLRYNNDNTKTFVKFEGDTPSFLDGKTEYTYSDVKAILGDENGEWFVDTSLE